MTTRPIVPESRRRFAYLAVALVVMTEAMLLTAGCVGWLGGTYKFDQNILVTKLNPDGIVVWTKLIDSGKYDFASDIIETHDGGFLVIGGTGNIVCGNFPHQSSGTSRLTRLSSTGEILWERDYAVRINSCVRNPNGGFFAVTDRGSLLSLDSDGNIVNEHHPQLRGDKGNDWQRIDIFAALENGGFILAGETIAKIDPQGNVSWQQLDDKVLRRAYAVTEMKNQQGYLVVIHGDVPLGPSVLELDRNGSIVQTVPMENFAEFPLPIIQQIDSGYTILSLNIFCPEHSSYCNQIYGAIHLDDNGKKIDSVNLTEAGSITVLPNGDGSFTSYAVISPGTIVKKTKYNANGSIEAEKTSQCMGDTICRTPFGNTPLHTSDGGFAIMSRIEKQQAC